MNAQAPLIYATNKHKTSTENLRPDAERRLMDVANKTKMEMYKGFE